MNLNDLSQNSNIEKKEDVIENLETAALKIKAENRIAELEKKSEEVINILEKFSEKIPTMINRLETINDGLKLESLNKTLENISNNSKEIYRMSKTISENSKWYNEKIVDTAEKQIYDTGRKARELIDEHSHFSFLIDKGILFIIITMFIINLAMVIFYKRQLNDVTSEVNKVHNVLMENKKYWIDENNYDIFIKYHKSKK
ncbi:MAG: hypothetical protein ACLUBL_08440 [Fusobacterium sp.]|uniref:hypothetical protein n=1 Tax=Fusobacterium sp. TaxID=68766 RepID=UPI0039927406